MFRTLDWGIELICVCALSSFGIVSVTNLSKIMLPEDKPDISAQRLWLDVFARDIAGSDISLEGMKDADLPDILRALIKDGIRKIYDISQPTEAECDERLPKGRDKQCAADTGNPLPSTPMLQRDFLKIEERKVKLQELRESGNLSELAKYEVECFDAIFAGMMGYKPAMFDPARVNFPDNYSVDDVVQSSLRSCSGMAVQEAYWIKELGLNAFMARSLHNVFGGEGHITFFAVDAENNTYFFDPAARVCCVPVPEGFYGNQENMLPDLKRLQNGDIRRFRLKVNNNVEAYKMNIPPNVVVSTLDDGLIDIFAFWTMENDKVSDEEKLKLSEQIDSPDDSDVLPLHIITERIAIFADLGDKEKAIQECKRALMVNPKGMSTLRYVSNALLDLGALEEGILYSVCYIDEALKVLNDFFNYMSYGAGFIEGKPGAIYILRMWVSVGAIVKNIFSQICLIFYYGMEDGSLSKEMISSLNANGQRLFEIYLDQFSRLDGAIAVMGFRKEVPSVTMNGEIFEAYCRMRSSANQLLSDVSSLSS